MSKRVGIVDLDIYGSSLPTMVHPESILHFKIPAQAATGGRSGVSVYKAGRSVPLDLAQLDLSRLALPQLGSTGVEKCFEIHVPSSGLKTNKKQKRSKNTFHE